VLALGPGELCGVDGPSSVGKGGYVVSISEKVSKCNNPVDGVNSVYLPPPGGELVAGFLPPVGSSSPGTGVSLLDTLTNISTFEREALLKKKVGRSGRRWSERSLVVAALKQVGRYKEAARMENCGRVMPYKCRVCGVVACRRHPWRCDLKVCPHCGQDRAAKLGNAMKLLVTAGKLAHPVFIILTVKNGHDYAERRAHLFESFRKLQRLDEFDAAISGGFVFYETTYNPREGWHPHLNVVADGWIDIYRLVALWQRCTVDSMVCRIRQIDPVEPSKTILELVKYVCKVSDIAASPELVDKFLEVEHNRRSLVAFGKCKGMMKTLADLEKKEVEVEEQAAVDLDCPVCGSAGSMEPLEGTAFRTDHLIYPGGWLVQPAELDRAVARKGVEDG
jgi:hypothetical protein